MNSKIIIAMIVVGISIGIAFTAYFIDDVDMPEINNEPELEVPKSHSIRLSDGIAVKSSP